MCPGFVASSTGASLYPSRAGLRTAGLVVLSPRWCRFTPAESAPVERPSSCGPSMVHGRRMPRCGDSWGTKRDPTPRARCFPVADSDHVQRPDRHGERPVDVRAVFPIVRFGHSEPGVTISVGVLPCSRIGPGPHSCAGKRSPRSAAGCFSASDSAHANWTVEPARGEGGLPLRPRRRPAPARSPACRRHGPAPASPATRSA